MDYVCGFIFNESKDRVKLIQKLRPAWQAGKLNGVGGKVGDIIAGETPLEAMKREGEEETTLFKTADWKEVAILNLPDYSRVFFYALFDQDLNKIWPLTEENLFSISVKDIYDRETMYYHEVIPNLRYLIQLALNNDIIKPVIISEK